MATRQGRLPDTSSTWEGKTNVVTSLNITLPAGEYPLTLTLSGLGNYCTFVNDSGNDNGADIYLCDSDGNNAYKIYSTYINARSRDYSFGAPGSQTWNIPESAGKALRGKTLAIKKVNAGGSIYFVGTATATVTTSVHTLTISSPNLSITQEEYRLTLNRSGSTTDNWGGTPSYSLYVDGAYKVSFSSQQISITLKDTDLETQHTYAVQVSSTANGHTASTNFASKNFTPSSVHKTVSYYNGSAWVECIPYYYTGSGWQEVWPYYYNGSEWVLCSKT